MDRECRIREQAMGVRKTRAKETGEWRNTGSGRNGDRERLGVRGVERLGDRKRRRDESPEVGRLRIAKANLTNLQVSFNIAPSNTKHLVWAAGEWAVGARRWSIRLCKINITSQHIPQRTFFKQSSLRFRSLAGYAYGISQDGKSFGCPKRQLTGIALESGSLEFAALLPQKNRMPQR